MQIEKTVNKIMQLLLETNSIKKITLGIEMILLSEINEQKAAEKAASNILLSEFTISELEKQIRVLTHQNDENKQIIKMLLISLQEHIGS